MASPTGALIPISALLAGTLWLSLRAVAIAGTALDVLPAHCRRRLERWQTHQRLAYLACAAVAGASGLVQLIS